MVEAYSFDECRVGNSSGGETIVDMNTDRPEWYRTVALTRYTGLDASGFVEELGDVALELSNNDRGNGLYQGYGLSVSGTIKSRATGEVPVTISTTSDLSRYYSSYYTPKDDSAGTPFVGEVSFRSDDGRTLAVTARDAPADELFVDRRYTGVDGEVRVTENVPFADVTIYGTAGEPARSD